ncbi:MAG: efflux RND transporter periplasmic adaptor subunit [Verrucomicrobia bacterium]|nr:efflux RND transporter periplasmic adaptor subunit [Verrucomicrobiota bacterium]
MKPSLKNYWKPLVLLAAVIAMIVYAGGMLKEKTPPTRVEAEIGFPVPDDAPVVEVVGEEISPRVEIVGTTQSDRRIQIGARINAYVKEVFANAGDRVTQGQLLITLDDREIQEQLAAVDAQLRQASREYQRTKQLFEQNAATEQSLTAAESAFNTARANMDRVKVTLSYAQVTSPIDGMVIERLVEVGDLANPGQALIAVYDPSDMRLDVPVPVRLIEKFALGEERLARLDYPAGIYTSTVKEIVGEIDPMTRTRRVKLQLTSQGEEILPGTFGRIWIEEDPRPTLLIPPESVKRVGQLELVYVVEDGRAVRRLIKTGSLVDGRLEVISGLEPGMRILANPAVRE